MKLVMFTKHLQHLDLAGLVDEGERCGLDGYDLCVRKGYVVSPGNAATALRDAAALFRAEGLDISMVTGEGSLTDPDAPDVEPLLDALSAADIRLLKLGYYRYTDPTTDYWAEVDRIRSLFDKWQQLGEKHGVTICYHTHAGDWMGCNTAAVMHLIRGFDPRCIGAYLDAGHLSAAGEEFSMACSMAGPYLRIVGLKAVRRVWRDDENGRSVTRIACRLEDGVADIPAALRHLAAIGFDGPLTVHIEYTATPQEAIEAGRRDAAYYRSVLKEIENEGVSPSRS